MMTTDETQAAWQCPKDATAMQPLGRRSGAWRCPQCRAVFLDTEAMRRGRGQRPPRWAPVVTSVVASLVATFIVRRLRHHTTAPRQAST
jgi:hypothetical protein